ncbi:MAG: serine protease [Polyangiales bacterium]
MRKSLALRRALMSAPLVFALANVACGVASESPNEKVGQAKGRIIGGTNASPGEFPWMVSIERLGATWSHSCGGTLITSSAVLTAAHCVDGVNASTLRVQAGGTSRTSLTQTSDVASYLMHEDYDVGATTYANDIAIIYLAQPFTLGGDVQLATLPQDNTNDFVGTTCQVAGWGRIDATNMLPEELQKASIPVISTEEANVRLSGVSGANVWDNQIALYDPAENITSSNGDNGGPVMCPWGGNSIVTGIQSWGVSSQLGTSLTSYPMVATRLSAYLAWIADNSDWGGTAPSPVGIYPSNPPPSGGTPPPPSTVNNPFTLTVKGTVTTYPEQLPPLNPPAGYVPPTSYLKNRPLKVVITYDATAMDYVLVKGPVCKQFTINDTVNTNPSGYYEKSYELPARCGDRKPRVTVSAGGGESTDVDSSAWPDYPTVTGNITNAPHLAYGGLWVRKIGNGKHPVIFTEGYDPFDKFTSEQTCDQAADGTRTCKPGGIIGMMRASSLVYPADPNQNFLDYLVTHDMSVYLILTGKNYGQSIKGLTANYVDGSAFAAAWLMQQVVAVYHPTPTGQPLIQAVVGGFSMGGLIVKNALNRWCAGDWDSVSLDAANLQSGCKEISAWYSADAPLEGATYPVALQRYIKDFNVSQSKGMLNAPEFNRPAAREMFKQWVSDGCHTNCKDTGGCSSKEGDFQDDCTVDNSKRNEFVAWEMSASNASTAHGVPWRMAATAGGPVGPVPAVAIAKGMDPDDVSKRPMDNQEGHTGRGCSPGNVNEAVEFFHTDVQWWGDHALYTNSALGTNECVHGSYMDTMYVDAKSDGTVYGFKYNSHLLFAPTFMPSSSALNWSRRPTWPSSPTSDAPGWWLDYWFNERDDVHVSAFPAGGARFLLGWISEYAIGTKDKPSCNRPYVTLGAKAKCRSALAADPPGGIDENGDDVE